MPGHAEAGPRINNQWDGRHPGLETKGALLLLYLTCEMQMCVSFFFKTHICFCKNIKVFIFYLKVSSYINCWAILQVSSLQHGNEFSILTRYQYTYSVKSMCLSLCIHRFSSAVTKHARTDGLSSGEWHLLTSKEAIKPTVLPHNWQKWQR